MKIGIDISQIVYGTGVSNYVKNLVANLLQIDDENEYLLWAGAWQQKEKIKEFLNNLPETDNYRTFVHPLPPTAAHWLWNRLHILPVENLIGGCDVFLSSDWVQPPTRTAHPATIVYDMIPWLYPQTQSKKTIKTHRARMNWVKKEAETIFAISQSTKKDLVKITGIPEEKVRVTYPGLNHDFFKPVAKKRIQKVKEKYNLNKYIFSLGTLEPRKNFRQVIASFNNLEEGALQLAIAGKFGWGKEISVAKDKKEKIKLLGYVPDEDLPALYSGAEVFVYPSLYEGFGMPIVEAQACGCPVITSNVSSMPEAAGQAAMLVNPEKPEEIKEAIEKIINDKGKRKKLIKAGLKNAKRFSWQKCARQILERFLKG